jgi:DNA repair protein RecN (Recombination protein N)
MLNHLVIKNFAIIDEVSIEFEPNMTVITGETGAGKSIIIDAIDLLLGSRASKDVIKHGEQTAIIQGEFTNLSHHTQTLLDQYDIEHDGDILIQRAIKQDGRNKVTINGMMVSSSILKEIAGNLVDIHSQHQSNYLLNQKNHLSLIDQLNQKIIQPVKKKYQNSYKSFVALKNEYEDALNKKYSEEHIDYIQFQLNEIIEANLSVEEEDELLNMKKQVEFHDRIFNALTEVVEVMSTKNDLNSSIYDVFRGVDQIRDVDTEYSEIADSLNDLYYNAEEIVSSANKALYALDSFEIDLNEIESRLFTYQKLKKKYGGSVEAVLETQVSLENELDKLADREEYLSNLKQRVGLKYEECLVIAEKLSKVRKKQAHTLEKNIKEYMDALHMPHANFKVDFSVKYTNDGKDKLSSSGKDDITFMISTNVGQPLKPINRVASGGEISRVMLALKIIFADVQGTETIIFDEIDTGVSGKVADSIGKKMHELGRQIQVFSITHNPQVAAISDHHLFVSKSSKNNETFTNVNYLSLDERTEKIAMMLSGENIDDVALSHARNLIANG